MWRRWGSTAKGRGLRRAAVLAAVGLVLLTVLLAHRGRAAQGSGWFFTVTGGKISFGRAAPPLNAIWLLGELGAHRNADSFFVRSFGFGASWAVTVSLFWPWAMALFAAGPLWGLIGFRALGSVFWGRRDPGRCAGCGYALVGLPEGAPCPECGDSAAHR